MNRPPLRRIILDTQARTPLHARVLTDDRAEWTTLVVGPDAPARRVQALSRIARVWSAPTRRGRIDLGWLLDRLGAEEITSLLVEGGGEVQASFLMDGYAHRLAFFYAPLLVGGKRAPRAVGGIGARNWTEVVRLSETRWRRVGPDLVLTARIQRHD